MYTQKKYTNICAKQRNLHAVLSHKKTSWTGKAFFHTVFVCVRQEKLNFENFIFVLWKSRYFFTSGGENAFALGGELVPGGGECGCYRPMQRNRESFQVCIKIARCAPQFSKL